MIYSAGKFLVFHEEEHHYTIQVDETDVGMEYSLYFSKASSWSENFRGSLIIKATDDGNGIRLSGKIERDLDYGLVEELTILLNFICKNNLKPTKYVYVSAEHFASLMGH